MAGYELIVAGLLSIFIYSVFMSVNYWPENYIIRVLFTKCWCFIYAIINRHFLVFFRKCGSLFKYIFFKICKNGGSQ